ncbi:hypothetical protein FFLO_05311 [Filobasidium floriforme]|uniref:Mg-dependent DNase n=1 Tax=Filobasidium floriforme TaxID=5210 RepID=A0A8K0JHL6_9TREE|nr:hypothetical protein FFLO_05311 [Filobasidium floriforme]
MFLGRYRGKQLHEADLDHVVQRAKDRGVKRMMITGTSLESSKQALELARRYDLHATVGCHPTSTAEMDSHETGIDGYKRDLEALIDSEVAKGAGSRMVAIGEIGLDYDRLHHSPADTQRRHLPYLLSLAEKYGLPMFLHSRHPDAHKDLVKVFKAAGWEKGAQQSRGRTGVVHSFTGSREEMEELLEYGLYIGINGCSLKTQENLEVVRAVPLDRIMLETDAPWCSVTTTAASHAYLPKDGPYVAVEKTKTLKPGGQTGVKGRNEPADVTTIAWVVAQVKGIPVDELAKAAWENSLRVFWPDRL